MIVTSIFAGWNWVEIVKIIPSVGTLAVACLALRNWKRQDKAKRQADFLDALVDATNSYTTAIARASTLIGFARIGMQSQVSSFEDSTVEQKISKGAVDYIKRDGKRDADLLGEALAEIFPDVIKLQSMRIKGRVFGFSDYDICQNSIKMLTWQYNRMQAFRSVIGSPSLNWTNPEVQISLDGILTVTPDSIDQYITDNSRVIVDFVQAAYRKIYGK